jgi:hypothetical protein
LPDSEKLPFALGRTDHHRDLQFLPGRQHRLQEGSVERRLDGRVEALYLRRF